MTGVNHGRPLLLQTPDTVQQVTATLRIHANSGLVKDQKFRLVQNGGREVQPTFHAAGDRTGQVVLPCGQPHLFQRLTDSLAEQGTTEIVQRAEETEILRGREIRVDCQVLRHDSQQTTHNNRFPGHVVSANSDLPGRHGEQSAQHHHCG